MIFAIIGFNVNKEVRFYRLYKKSVDIEYIKSKYAGMVIAFVIDREENTLFVSNVISRMMQALDILMNRVCELNLIYCLDKVYALVDGFVCDGKIIDMEPLRIAGHGQH
ncbi:UNVERIFIED_CONTAM: hypothetical protein PYX00_011781 [Menopon gallinae]|uniref:AP complex mu/sigma subunit domain-containing protein n=1 Tax=Menopon gallinae TaxID=328185 RepID=A0AAW2H8A1_9NEOP